MVAGLLDPTLIFAGNVAPFKDIRRGIDAVGGNLDPIGVWGSLPEHSYAY